MPADCHACAEDACLANEHVRQAALTRRVAVLPHLRQPQAPPGFPDVVCLRDDQLVVAESKSAGKKPTPMQAKWLDAFRALEALMT